MLKKKGGWILMKKYAKLETVGAVERERERERLFIQHGKNQL